MYKILLIAFLFALISSQSCGGNCANNWCATCDCGQEKSFPDLDQLCGAYQWEKNCCKCIITRISGGNTNYITGVGWDLIVNRAGLMGFTSYSCDYSNKQRCDPKITMPCMFNIYSKTSDWSYWAEARNCGCLGDSNLEAQ